MNIFKIRKSRLSRFLLMAIPVCNLLFMHYFFYFREFLEWTWMYSEVLNLCGVIFDVSLLIILFLILSRGCLKFSLAMTQLITLLWSFANVMYGKFFFQYMSLSAIGEAHGLEDVLVINSMLSAFYWYDLYYLLSFFLFIFVFKRVQPCTIEFRMIGQLLLIPVFSIAMTFVAYSAYHFIHPHFRNNWELYKFRSKEFLFDSVRGGTPNLAHFQTGCIRVALFELYDMFHVVTLTAEQKKQIVDYYSDQTFRASPHKCNPNIKNVVFILLESFLSAPIDLKVDGKEVTPFLNSLKRDSNVYYNGNMISDIGCGESGDGQFIYMTGILPLRHRMTVGQVKNNTLPALPKVLRKSLGIKYSEIISPTAPNLWQQSEMNKAYGFCNAFWLEDIISGQVNPIDDGLIFKFASKRLEKLREPFFSLILSLSTHSPYTKYVGGNIMIGNRKYNELYKNYLNSCHFLDEQLKKYITALKKKGLYNRSLIVIASDHYAHLDMLGMKDEISDNTPLYIINGNVNNDYSTKSVIHQLDLYTTLIDCLQIQQSWRGLGHTLLNPQYTNSVDESTYNLSKMIIEGDFFNRR